MEKCVARTAILAVFAALLFSGSAAALDAPTCPTNQVCIFSGVSLKPVESGPPGRDFSTSGFSCPVNAPVTGAYGTDYTNPNGEKRVRQGVEIRVPEGTDVRAAGAGAVVESRTDLLTRGRYVTIRHATNPNVETTYGFLQHTDKREGDKINKNDIVGKSGKIEANAFPSLYFELRRGGLAQREVEEICKTKETQTQVQTPVQTTLPQTGSCKFVSPVPNYKRKISSSAGTLRPTGSGDYRHHKGDDIGVSSGTTASAVCDGTVYTNRNENVGGYGGEIVISCDCKLNGKQIYARYGHLKQRDVKKEQRVTASQAIGLTGGAANDPDRGSSTGAHLHFELRTGGDYGAPFLLPQNYIS